MGFLRRIFGARPDKGYVDKQGLYFYVQCEKCGSKVRVRADKQHDLNRDGGGFVWHKTIVDSQCFQHMPVVVHMDGSYQVTSHEISGGQFITKEEYDAPPPNAAEETDGH